MAIINNLFSKDDTFDRMERLHSLQGSIDDIAAELGVTGNLLAWAQNCEDQWKEARSEARTKEIAKERAFSEFRYKQIDCKKLYQKAKNILKAMIAEHDNTAEIMHAYSINGTTPRTREGLESAVDDLSRQHEIYKAAGDPWVLPDHIVDEIRALRTEMSVLHTTACTLLLKAKVAREAMKARFREDTKRLRLIYEMGVLVWGVDSSNFIGRGFLPKSMVWTKKRPPSPENFRFDESAKTFRWSFIDGADSYEAHYRAAGEGGHWTAFYEGAENSCPPPEGLTGSFDFRVRAIANGKEGHWSGSASADMQ